MTEPLAEVTIYTDGGADPNPGTGGWAAVLIDAATPRTGPWAGPPMNLEPLDGSLRLG